MINHQKLTLMILKNEENGKSTPDNTTELAKLMRVTYEEASSMKDLALSRGIVTKVRDASTGKPFLCLTEKGRVEGGNYQKIMNQASTNQKKVSTPVVRRAGLSPANPTNKTKSSVKALNIHEKEHFMNGFNQLTNSQLAFYHLILANSLGTQTFNYLNFKFLNGVLRVAPTKVQQSLQELEDLGLIKLEGIDNNIVKPNHSYSLLSNLFPDYCKETDVELNNYLKELYFAPHLVEESNLRSLKGDEIECSTDSGEVNLSLNTNGSFDHELSNPTIEPITDSVLSVGELRHHTTQNHSSMPEIEQTYWNQQAIYPGYLNNGIQSQTYPPMARPNIHQPLNPYPVKRNPLTILIDGDQQSLKGFMKEAKLDRLRSGDSIYLFSARGAHSNLSTELVHRIEELKENVYFKRITSEIRRPNTMDHLIITRLTMLLTADFNRDFIILSEDKGFAGAITMLNDAYNLRRGQIQLQTIAIL